MPFALILIGLVLVVSAVRDTTDTLVSTVKGDFEGPNNFTYWLVAILIVGGLGYIPSLEKISRLFLVLVILGLFLSHGGFFEKFNQQAFGGSVENVPIDLGGIMGTFTGNPSTLGGINIETPMAPARPNVSQ